MKKEIIIVPKDQSPIDFIKRMQKEGLLKSAWIFVHVNVAKKIAEDGMALVQDDFEIDVDKMDLENPWIPLDAIENEDIDFQFYCAADPENLFFFKSEE